MNFPERIEQLSIQVAAKTREVQDLREQIGLKESAATLEVLNARDEEGRPLYSNETARGAALKRALAATETERAELLANLECARNEFRLHLLDRQQEIAVMSNK